MANSKARRHIHKYHKVNAQFVKLWACAHPECSHHMPKHLEEFVLGKASICWNCDKQFAIDDESFAMDKPQCHSCLHPKEMTEEDKMLLDYVNSLKD